MTHLIIYMLNQRKRASCHHFQPADHLPPVVPYDFATYVNEIVVKRQITLIVGVFNLHCELNSGPGVKVLIDILAVNNL